MRKYTDNDRAVRIDGIVLNRRTYKSFGEDRQITQIYKWPTGEPIGVMQDIWEGLWFFEEEVFAA